MSFVYSVDFHEDYAQGYGKFTGPSQEHSSTRRSQFQCIGWVLECIDRVKEYSRDSSIEVYANGYDVEGLVEVGKLEINVAYSLLRARSWEDRFNVVWAALDERQKSIALKMNYSRNESFWPYFGEATEGANPESVCDRYREALRKPRECEDERDCTYYAMVQPGKDRNYVLKLGPERHNKDFYHCFGGIKNSANS